jgi:UDP-glucuronate decarboxylase
MTPQSPIKALARARTAHRTLVTGGAGFIGSHLCDALLQRGDQVICLDNLFSGSMRNVRPLMNHPNFTFVEGDVRDPLEIDVEIDRIYNLACPASPRHYQRDPLGFCRRPPAKYTATRKYIRNRNPMSATSIPSVHGLVTTKANGPPRR